MRNLKLLTCVLLTCLALAILPASCNRYQVHPGSINTFDSVTADTLASIKTTIDSARPQVADGQPLAKFKPQFNALVTAYDAAIGPYKAWHDAAKVTPSTSSTQVQALLAAATKALSEWSTATGGK